MKVRRTKREAPPVDRHGDPLLVPESQIAIGEDWPEVENEDGEREFVDPDDDRFVEPDPYGGYTERDLDRLADEQADREWSARTEVYT